MASRPKDSADSALSCSRKKSEIGSASTTLTTIKAGAEAAASMVNGEGVPQRNKCNTGGQQQKRQAQSNACNWRQKKFNPKMWQYQRRNNDSPAAHIWDKSCRASFQQQQPLLRPKYTRLVSSRTTLINTKSAPEWVEKFLNFDVHYSSERRICRRERREECSYFNKQQKCEKRLQRDDHQGRKNRNGNNNRFTGEEHTKQIKLTRNTNQGTNTTIKETTRNIQNKQVEAVTFKEQFSSPKKLILFNEKTSGNLLQNNLTNTHSQIDTITTSTSSTLVVTDTKTYSLEEVKPLTETLKQETIAVTEEESQQTSLKPFCKSFGRIRQSSSSNSGAELNINERLANMDKEGLKYIINNSDTIYDEHLKLQARRRLREEIRRQLKAIELEQPKHNTAHELVEDAIVDAIKLPEVLLQEIQKLFGIDISGKVVGSECGEDKTKDSRAIEELHIIETTMVKDGKSSTDLMSRLKVAQEFKAMAGSRAKNSSGSVSQDNPEAKPTKKSTQVDQLQQSKSAKKDSGLKVCSLSEIDRSAYKSKSNNEQVLEEPVQMLELSSQKKAQPACVIEPIAPAEHPIDTPIKVEIKQEVPILTASSAIIVLSSSEDEDDNEPSNDTNLHLDDAATDSSNCNRASVERRHTLKLKNDAKNVVSRFEQLILPNLSTSLQERYCSKHKANLQTQLHFISCVCTSEYNSQKFSKIEIARIQKNLKATNNRLGIEFLLREIVNVVNLQKHTTRRKQQREQPTTNEISSTESLVNGADSTKSAEIMSDLKSKGEAHQTNAAESADAAAKALDGTQTPAPTPPRNPTPTGVGANGILPLNQNQMPRLTTGPYLSLEHALPRLSPSNFTLPGALDGTEHQWQLGHTESITQNLLEIDRRLLENQSRRSFLEEMIMKFQKEKSDLEMLTLELQSRKFLLLNTVIARNQNLTGGLPSPPPGTQTPLTSPTLIPTISPIAPSARASLVIPSKTKTRLRRAIVVKRVKLVKNIKKRPAKGRSASKSDSHEAQPEIEHLLQTNNKEKHTESDIVMPLPMSENVLIKEEPGKIPERPPRSKSDVLESQPPSAESKAPNAKRPRLVQPKHTSSVTLQQPLAIIPPLPPPPPPPEPIAQMSYDLPRILLKTLPSISRRMHEAEPSAQPISNLNYGYIPSGRLHSVTSPITQIRIYKLYIIAAAEDGDVYMFNIGNHKLERQITKHSEAITNMFLCERESFLYTTSLDGFLKKSSLENLERVQQTVYFKEPLQSIDIAWGIAFIGSRWGNVFTYNVSTNKVMDMPLLSAGQSIIAVKATKEGMRKIIMLGCKGNFVHMHDAATGLLLRRLGIPVGLNVYSLLLNDGHVYCGTQKNEIFKFDFATGSLISTLSCGNGAVSMATYRDRYLLVGCYDGYIYVLDKVNCTQFGRFEGSGRLVLALAIAGDKVVTSSKDNSLEILEIPAALLSTNQNAVA